MMIEFAAQELFLANRDDYDWFLFLEDDIAILDPLFLDKIREFNKHAAAPKAVLLPHRFEMNGTSKVYIDHDAQGHQGGRSGVAVDLVNPLTIIRYPSPFLLGRPVAFAEFGNPHAACFCLNAKQLAAWADSGRHWYRKVMWIGPLESAATGCLLEVFDLYKPHPDLKRFLEVQHLDLKYSLRTADSRNGQVSSPT